MQSKVTIHRIDSERSREAFYSTVHGAERIMSRTQAAGKVRWKKGRQERVSTVVIDWDQTQPDVAAKGIMLFGGGADEAPGVYKKLTEVMEAHKGTRRSCSPSLL